MGGASVLTPVHKLTTNPGFKGRGLFSLRSPSWDPEVLTIDQVKVRGVLVLLALE